MSWWRSKWNGTCQKLIVLAPGVERFGEDNSIDKLIRKYDYIGREKIVQYCEQYDELKRNLSAAAQLIHGSSDGRFKITYYLGHFMNEKGVGGSSAMPYFDPKRWMELEGEFTGTVREFNHPGMNNFNAKERSKI